jgi:hypothetical protein
MRGRSVRGGQGVRPRVRGGTLGDGGEASGPVPKSGERINILLVGVDTTPKRSATLHRHR